MKKPLHLQAIANVDMTKASRKNSLSEEYSQSYKGDHLDEFAISERTDADDFEFVQSLYQEILQESRFVSQERLSSIPRFGRNEVIEGLTLGKGSFGTINAVKGFSLDHNNNKENLSDLLDDSIDDFAQEEEGEMELRQIISDNCYHDNGDARYALKRLQNKTLNDNLDCLRGMTDLANETLFLGSIYHPHIIGLRGISTDDICSKDFFIILDRLYDTLASRLVKWKAEEKKLFGLKRIFRTRGALRRRDLLADRLDHAAHLASALTYLHEHRIIHRDLKPENIGFDVDGVIQIFDFGLARELPKKLKGSSDNTFSLTMSAGTPRYMAPEVASGVYNEACDIYSLSLLLWEFITLKRPYKDQKSVEEFEQNVWCPNGARPKISKLSPGLERLLEQSWDYDILARPSATEFENTLRAEITKLEDESSDGEMDSELFSPTSPSRRLSALFLTPGGKKKRISKQLDLLPTSLHGTPLCDPHGTSVRTNLTDPLCQSFHSAY